MEGHVNWMEGLERQGWWSLMNTLQSFDAAIRKHRLVGAERRPRGRRVGATRRLEGE
jgi:hypothetical protein